MTTLDAILLGIIQGLTEFLPVSSSGHLKLAEYFLGLTHLDHYLLFDIGCHLGTLTAIFVVFYSEIRTLLFGPKNLLLQVAIATLPLFPLVLFLKPIKSIYADPSFLGYFFLITSAILFAGIWIQRKPRQEKPLRDSIFIGFWQALAILPGISRSGSTISGAKILGWDTTKSVTFSFLLAIPAILGATILEGYKVWKEAGTLSAEISINHYATGFFVSFIVGIFALKLVIQAAARDKFSYFAWYCLFLGLATTAYFHL